MSIEVAVIADSVNPVGDRLTTMWWKYPRFIHSEVLTHRALSRNSASSRAIPIEKMIQRVIDDPVIPIWWGKAQPGMQADEEVETESQKACRQVWRQHLQEAVRAAKFMSGHGLHKQVVNRLLEPWMHIEVIVSATEWNNFILLRDDPAAEPHIRALAQKAKEAMAKSEPRLVTRTPDCQVLLRMTRQDLEGTIDSDGCLEAMEMWHTPFVEHTHRKVGMDVIKESVAHCAWVSYLNAWQEATPEKVERVYAALLESQPIHASPAEHVAVACSGHHRHGNFVGWLQYRKLLRNESGGDYLER